VLYASIIFQDIFRKKWSEHFKITNESEYPNYILYNNNKLPSRSKHIYIGSESPLPYLKKDIVKFNSMNPDFIIIPCNTVHYYYDDLNNISKVPILNLIKIVSEYLLNTNKNEIFILGTEALIKEKLYSKYGLKNVTYSNDLKNLRKIIDSIKHNTKIDDILNLFKSLLDINKVNVLCCTELSVLYHDNENYLNEYKIIDPLVVISDYIIQNIYQFGN
jgi:aspartate racemase